MVWNIFESHKLAIGRLYFEKQMVDGCVTQVVISCSEVGSKICLYRFVNGRLYRSNCFNSFFLLAETFNYFLKPLKTGFKLHLFSRTHRASVLISNMTSSASTSTYAKNWCSQFIFDKGLECYCNGSFFENFLKNENPPI